MLGQLAEMGIGLGANSVLLKYSRGAESDADLLGARIMAQAGYNPMEAARFFEKLEAETGKRSGIEQFFSSHPNPGNRSQRIEKELQYLPKGPYQGDTGKLPQIQAILRKTKAK
jgi:predicted Zn-dependent protease